jgi:NitT/TauT family transport system substrate-binding protein
VKKFATAHAELTDWVNTHPDEAKKLVNAELKEITRREMSPELTDRAWARLHFTSKVDRQAIEAFVGEAQNAGFLRGSVDLSRLVAVP